MSLKVQIEVKLVSVTVVLSQVHTYVPISSCFFSINGLKLAIIQYLMNLHNLLPLFLRAHPWGWEGVLPYTIHIGICYPNCMAFEPF